MYNKQSWVRGWIMTARNEYNEAMSKMKVAMRQSIEKIFTELPNKIHGDKLDLFKNLRYSKSDPECDLTRPCYDDLWNNIERIFNKIREITYSQTMNAQEKEAALDKCKHDFRKDVISLLNNSGVPFVDNRALCFWSTTFARDEAKKYAEKNNAVTDGMAQDILRLILVGWPGGSLNVGYQILKNDQNNLSPELAKFFWGVMSEAFADEAKPGSEVHVFFQQGLTAGNFFWNDELQAIRQKGNVTVFLHEYDLSNGRWPDSPKNLDDKDLDVLVRRREIHSSEQKDPSLGFSKDKTTFDQTFDTKGIVTARAAPSIKWIQLRSTAMLFRNSVKKRLEGKKIVSELAKSFGVPDNQINRHELDKIFNCMAFKRPSLSVSSVMEMNLSKLESNLEDRGTSIEMNVLSIIACKDGYVLYDRTDHKTYKFTEPDLTRTSDFEQRMAANNELKQFFSSLKEEENSLCLADQKKVLGLFIKSQRDIDTPPLLKRAVNELIGYIEAYQLVRDKIPPGPEQARKKAA